MKIQPKVHCHIFIITNEGRDEIFDFAGSYVEAVEKFKNGFHDFYDDRCVAKIQMIEDGVFGSCVPHIEREKVTGDDIPF
ncbi:hypothetical protein PP938_gp232 [Rhizobium phage AF3]|uniref:Uncharacterized protein n=1 Tax=Rhizobium phage AF3 TaxID=2763529 RepID=A0A7G7WWG9_9CAUD|nr:hypothetical protein PP938_gp232 [Rhizobium phage AF3]QNH71563.1 hypothetical protein AF3_232 [Rhizobium phage AF3]